MALQTAPFIDADAGNRRTATEFEIRELQSGALVWSSFVPSWQPDQAVLEQRRVSRGRSRGEWAWSTRPCMPSVALATAIPALTRSASGPPGRRRAWSSPHNKAVLGPNPMRLRDNRRYSLRWTADDGAPVVLQPGSSLLISGSVSPLHEITGGVVQNSVRDFGRAPRFESTFFKFDAGPEGLEIPPSRVAFRDAAGVQRSVWLPYMKLNPGRFLIGAPSAAGAFFFEPDDTVLGEADTEPILISQFRSPQVPWRAQPGFRVELVADVFTLPVRSRLYPGLLTGPRLRWPTSPSSTAPSGRLARMVPPGCMQPTCWTSDLPTRRRASAAKPAPPV